MWDNQHFRTCFPQRKSDRYQRQNHPDARPAYSSASKSKWTVPVCDGARCEPPSVEIPVQFVRSSNHAETPPKAGGSSDESTAKKPSPPMNKAEAALKIQSAFRGFSVRKAAPLKNLKVIFRVKAKMEEIRERIQKPQVVDSIRQNEKERLRISEEIMSLLLELDAIQGVSSDLREARKSVIRELINLQETVDAIVNKSSDDDADDPAAEGAARPEIASSPGENSQPGESNVAVDAANDDVEIKGTSHRPDQVDSITEHKDSVCNGPEDNLETRRNAPFLPLSSENKVAEQSPNPNCGEDAGGIKECTVENQGLSLGLLQNYSVPSGTEEENTKDVREEMKSANASKEIDIISRLQAEEDSKDSIWHKQELENSIWPEESVKDSICSADEADRKHGSCTLEGMAPFDDEIDNEKWQSMEFEGPMLDVNPPVGGWKDEKMDDCVAVEEAAERAIDGSTASEAEAGGTERLIDDNRKLKKMVADLCQKNDMQSDMISNLSQRIAKLEKRILHSYNRKKMDRRKKKKNPSSDS